MIKHTARSVRGFTLIELLVVIAIIGLLASIVLASLNSARIKGRDARRIADLKQIQNALEMYASDNAGRYPTTASTSLSAYISVYPTDPGTSYYNYAASSTQLSYCLTARLEGSLPSGGSSTCTNGITTPAPGGSGGTVDAVTN